VGARAAGHAIVGVMALVEGVDFYINAEGLMVFTAVYLRKRGYCCQSGCRHCPYGFQKPLSDPGSRDNTKDEPKLPEKSRR
jgi:hypothetical protein